MSTTTEVKEKYAEFKTQLAAAHKQVTDMAQTAFKEFAAEYFERFPKVNSFGWDQFQPYWNDGDPCEFSVDTYSIRINGSNTEDEDDYIDCPNCDSEIDPDAKVCPACDAEIPQPEAVAEISESELKSACTGVTKLLGAFDDITMKVLYGDHVEVTIHRDGTATTQDYEHE